MSECVAEAGKPTLVAKVKYRDEAMTAHTMPSMRTAGLSANWFVSTILVRIVSATRAPTPTAPENSMTAATIMAGSI
jgi:hypothetical protein